MSELSFQQTYKELTDLKYAIDISSIICRTDSNGIIEYVNEKFCTITNFNTNDLIGKKLTSFLDTDSKSKINELAQFLIQGNDWKGELVFLDSLKNKHLFQTSIIPLINHDGITYQLIIICQDITAKKQAEEELRQNQAFFINGPVIFFKWSNDFQVQYVSENIKQFGYRADEFINGERTFISIVHPDDIGRIIKSLQKISNSNIDWFRHDYRMITACKKTVWVYDFIKVVRNDKGEIVQFNGYILDVTEQKLLEELLKKSDKLNSVGELAAGVAHEIKNPLTSIKGFSQMLKPNIDESMQSYVQIILNEIARIEEILTEFMNLAKPANTSTALNDIIKIINDTISLMNSEAILNDVIIKGNFHNEPILIDCNENQIKQVFVNLIKNAIEAMPDGGKVEIYTTINDNTLTISIRDYGCGIPEHLISQIGKPFYTTKKSGNGLGLMVSNKIIEEHHGELHIESKENEGTIFTIHLPYKVKLQSAGVFYSSPTDC